MREANAISDMRESNASIGRATRFAPPGPDEVAAYCQERKNAVDPQRFIDYYTSNGWKVGKNPMKDWRAAVRTWERTSNPAQTQKNAGRKTFTDLAVEMEEQRK